MSVRNWSTTASSNSNSDSGAGINWAEGQLPSTVNNSSRAVMAEVKKWSNDTSGAIISTGTEPDYVLTTGSTITALENGLRLTFRAHATSTGAATATVDALAQKSIKRADNTATQSGDIVSGSVYDLAYSTTAGAFIGLNVGPAKATVAEVFAASANKYIAADHLTSATAAVALTDASTVAVNWTTFIYATLELGANRILGNPTNEIPGQWRYILVDGDDTTDRTLTFDTEYLNVVPTLTDIDSTRPYLLVLFCEAAGVFHVTAYKARDI